MMNDKARKEQPATDKKKTGKQRPNMMSNQGPGNDASTGKFATGLFGSRRKKTPNKRTQTAMGGLIRFGE